MSPNKSDPAANGCEEAMPPYRRSTVSGAVDWAWEQLRQRHALMKTALDIGCGKGRNSLFLARKGMQVTSLDIAPNAIEALQRNARRYKLASKIRAFAQDVGEDWPIEPQTIDFAVDAFCFKHVTPIEACEVYKKNLLRVVTARGHYLLSFASLGDGYYGHYVRGRKRPPVPADEAVKIDAAAGIESPLYTPDKAIAFFRPELEVLAESRNRGGVIRAGDKETHALLFRFSPKWFYG